MNSILLNDFSFSGEDQAQGEDQAKVNHPPKLLSTWSSALIPFCAYKTNLNFSGNSPFLADTTFPLCSSFLPTILEGQLCYKLTVNDTSGKGKKNELMLLLDYNEHHSLQVPGHRFAQAFSNSIIRASSNETLDLDTEVESIESSSAKIQINTLSPYIGEVELYEDCRTRKLFEHCNCVPWEVHSFQV